MINLGVLLAFAALAVGMTWPLTANLTHDIPGDLGDPVFVAGVLARASDHWLQFIGGDWSAVTRYWQAGFFYPEPDVTAYSEHFLLHALMTLPVWVATRNIILCYNLLFLASFALSGFCMYLLVKELTGSWRGAFVAGVIFAFLPYRVATLSHLQVLSSYWMPLTLLGLYRFIAKDRPGGLVAGAGALWAQGLSSGYYLVFFGPFVGVFSVAAMWAVRQVTNWKKWGLLVLAAASVLLLALPTAIPYLRLHERYHHKRSLAEVAMFSADLLAWVTASSFLNLWGGLQTYSRAEGVLFPGLTGVVLMLAGLALAWRRTFSRGAADVPARTVAAFCTLAVPLAVWLAFGPAPAMKGQPLDIPSLYLLLYDYVPGYDVARVPSRFAMIAFLAMAMAAGLSAARIDRTAFRPALWVVVIAALAEGAYLPIDRNRNWSSVPQEMKDAPARVYPEAEAPAVYKYLKTLPRGSVITHFPFAYPEREIQYGFYSALHGQRIVNGYSGSFPMVYLRLAPILHHPLTNMDLTFVRLRDVGVTHITVDTAAWLDPTMGGIIVDAFKRKGFREVARFDKDVVLAAPR